MAEKALGLAGMGDDSSGSPDPLSQFARVASAVGLNMTELNQQRDRMIESMGNAKDEARAAEHRADLVRLEAQIAQLQEGRQGGVLDEISRELLLDRMRPDPLEGALRERVAERMMGTLEADAHPPSLVDQVSHAANTLKDLRELSGLFAPPPSAAGLTPERQMELELKKLELEERLAERRIDSETEAQKAKANSWTEITRMIGGALESVGKSLAAEMLAQSGALDQPTAAEAGAASRGDPAAHAAGAADQSTEAKAVQCPDCQQQAIYVTPAMIEQAQRGPVKVVCTSCGSHHTIGGEAPAAEGSEASDSNGTGDSGMAAIRKRRMEGGREVPRFTVGA